MGFMSIPHPGTAAPKESEPESAKPVAADPAIQATSGKKGGGKSEQQSGTENSPNK